MVRRTAIAVNDGYSPGRPGPAVQYMLKNIVRISTAVTGVTAW